MDDYSGEIAIVTGGTRGIGRAVSATLTAGNATVVAVYRSDRAAADRTADELAQHAGSFHTRAVDVSDPDAVEAVVEGTVEDHGLPTMLVNSAGIVANGPLVRTVDTDWAAVLETNLTGAFNCLRAVGRRMLAGDGGSVVNVSSVAGMRGWPGQANYAASKAGLAGLTRSAARELGPRGIRVNAVAPGYVGTDLLDSSTADPADDTDRIPLGRTGDPEEIADSIAYLLGEEASYVNGVVLRVDGGLLA